MRVELKKPVEEVTLGVLGSRIRVALAFKASDSGFQGFACRVLQWLWGLCGPRHLVDSVVASSKLRGITD